MNSLGLLGVLVAVVGAGLLIAELASPTFVEVFIDDADGEQSDPIAGLGVFSTYYDSSVLSDEELAQSRLPEGDYTVDTTEFELLFPAQTNFIGRSAPLTEQALAALDAFGVPDEVVQGMAASLAELNTREFSNCEDYVDDTIDNMTSLLAPLNGVLPSLVPVLINQSSPNAVAQLAAGIEQVVTGLQAEPANGNTFIGILQTLHQATHSVGENLVAGSLCPSVPATAAITESAGAIDFACLSAAANGTAQSEQLAPRPALALYFSALADLYTECSGLAAEEGESTVFSCLTRYSTTWADTLAAYATVEFDIAPGQPGSICTLLSNCDETTPALVFLGFHAQVAAEAAGFLTDANTTESLAAAALFQNGAAGLTALAGVVRFFGPALIPDGVTPSGIADRLTTTLTEQTPTPVTFADTYYPCALLQLNPNTPDLTNGGATSCGFLQFFSSLSTQLPFVAEAQTLYGGCLVLGGRGVIAECPTFWPYLISNAAWNSPIADLTAANDVLQQGLIGACEDDVEDKIAIQAAQGLLVVSAVFYVLTIILGVTGSVVAGKVKGLFVGAGLCSIVALVLNISALLVVQAAPVYDGVGGEAEPFSAYFEAGSVTSFAFASLALMAVAAVLFFIAACKAPAPEASAEDKVEARKPSV